MISSWIIWLIILQKMTCWLPVSFNMPLTRTNKIAVSTRIETMPPGTLMTHIDWKTPHSWNCNMKINHVTIQQFVEQIPFGCNIETKSVKCVSAKTRMLFFYVNKQNWMCQCSTKIFIFWNDSDQLSWHSNHE